MKENNREKTIYGVTARILQQIESSLESSSTKALLADLRKIDLHDTRSLSSVWQVLFENLPEDFFSKTGILTREESSILLALQLYAIHRQSNSNTVNSFDKTSLGQALNRIRDDDSQSLDRRFNVLITSSSFEELQNHLRQILKLLKAKDKNKSITLDYAKLAQEIFFISLGHGDKIRLRWAQSYYRIYKKEEKDNEQG